MTASGSWSECHALLRAVEEEERGLLAKRSAAVEAQALRTRWVLGLGSGSLLMLLVVAGAVIERDIRNRERTRQDLRRSEERLRLALDAANAGTWEWDLQTNENVWSEELWKVYGLEPHSCRPSYEAWRQLVHPDDRAHAEQVVAEAARTGTELNVEFRVCDGDGSERWLLSRGRPVAGCGKGRARVSSASLWISPSASRPKRRCANASRTCGASRRSRPWPSPCSTARCDTWPPASGSGTIITWASRSCWDAATTRSSRKSRSGGARFTAAAWRERWSAIPESEFLRADGAEQWIRWEIQPWHRADGDIGGIVLFSEDITGQKRSEEALRESEAQFRTLANAIPQLCWMANADGWIFWYNQRWYEYTGTTPEQMEGWGWQSVHDPAALPKVLDRWKASIATGEPFDMVFPLRGADGVFHPFLTRIMPVRDRDGKVVRWFGTNTDISEQQKTEEALRQASEQRRLALEAAELGAWDYHFETGDVFWDETCRNMFGVPTRQPDRLRRDLVANPSGRPRCRPKML